MGRRLRNKRPTHNWSPTTDNVLLLWKAGSVIFNTIHIESSTRCMAGSPAIQMTPWRNLGRQLTNSDGSPTCTQHEGSSHLTWQSENKGWRCLTDLQPKVLQNTYRIFLWPSIGLGLILFLLCFTLISEKSTPQLIYINNTNDYFQRHLSEVTEYNLRIILTCLSRGPTFIKVKNHIQSNPNS